MRNLTNLSIFPRTARRLAGSVLVTFLASSAGANGGSLTPTPPLAPTPNYSLTAANLAQQMSPGINLGNTLEAIDEKAKAPSAVSLETHWENPPANQAIFDAYKAAGFKSVRIPVSWSQYADADNNISPFWMARVKQVVDEARKSGLYVMINIHWDGGWMDHTTYAQQSAINAKLAKFWTQIAVAFKDYDDHLLFAGSNEVAMEHTYSAPTAENCAVQKSFNQTFVNAVRPTGGNNASRFLVVQGYITNVEYTISCNATLPADTVPNRLAMEVHYYDPYNFTLNDHGSVWQWGQSVATSANKESWADESQVDDKFQKLKTTFVDKGVPVIMGEYGAYLKPAYPGMNTYRLAWIQYVTKSMVSHGLAPMWWDTGELFDRTTGAVKTPDALHSIIRSAQ
jgi:endoglucanase